MVNVDWIGLPSGNHTWVAVKSSINDLLEWEHYLYLLVN